MQRFIVPIPKLSKTFNYCWMKGSYAPLNFVAIRTQGHTKIAYDYSDNQNSNIQPSAYDCLKTTRTYDWNIDSKLR